MSILGFDAGGINEFDVDFVKMQIEAGITFDDYWQEQKENLLGYWIGGENIEITESVLKKIKNVERQFYERVRKEMEQESKIAEPLVYADIGYRLPLSVALRKVENHDKRVSLLKLFYKSYNNA